MLFLICGSIMWRQFEASVIGMTAYIVYSEKLIDIFGQRIEKIPTFAAVLQNYKL